MSERRTCSRTATLKDTSIDPSGSGIAAAERPREGDERGVRADGRRVPRKEAAGRPADRQPRGSGGLDQRPVEGRIVDEPVRLDLDVHDAPGTEREQQEREAELASGTDLEEGGAADALVAEERAPHPQTVERRAHLTGVVVRAVAVAQAAERVDQGRQPCQQVQDDLANLHIHRSDRHGGVATREAGR
jgi:hypothetical protein